MAESAGTMSNLKDFATFLREGTIAAVLLLFLLLPGVMRNILVRGGFTSADIAGFKWELQKSAQQTQNASETVAQLENKLSTLQQRLDQINQAATAPEVKREITTVAAELGQTRTETKSVHTKLQDSLAAQKSVIQQVDPKLFQQMEMKPQ